MTSPASAGPTARERLTLTRSSLDAARSCVPRHQLRDGRPPAGLLQCEPRRPMANVKATAMQRHIARGGERCEDAADHEEVRPAPRTAAAVIEGVSQDCPRERQQHDGKGVGGLDQGDHAAALGASTSSHWRRPSA